MAYFLPRSQHFPVVPTVLAEHPFIDTSDAVRSASPGGRSAAPGRHRRGAVVAMVIVM